MLPFSPDTLPASLRDPGVLEALERVPRERFVPSEFRAQADENIAIAIGFRQTISQPYIVAFMTAALRVEPGQRILEVGTGSGYQCGVLAALGATVFSIEIIPELAQRASRTLVELGLSENVQIIHANGRQGWPKAAPFDGVLCAAASEDIPAAFVNQVRVGGHIVLPIEESEGQILRVLRKEPHRLEETHRLPVRFVPLVHEDPRDAR